jgi:hypothetical protein
MIPVPHFQLSFLRQDQLPVVQEFQIGGTHVRNEALPWRAWSLKGLGGARRARLISGNQKLR